MLGSTIKLIIISGTSNVFELPELAGVVGVLPRVCDLALQCFRNAFIGRRYAVLAAPVLRGAAQVVSGESLLFVCKVYCVHGW